MDETWYLTCSTCKANVEARLVFPTTDRSIYVVGRCTHCAQRGERASVVFKYKLVHHDEWMALMSIDNLPVAR